MIAHQSVLQFKRSERPMPEIARLLDVKYVVDGSVLQDGERVRITVNLIDAARNTPLWGESFERERRDVMALQREVALAIAQAIEVTLTPQDRVRLAATPQVNPKAFDLYVRGTQARYAANFTGDFREATRYLEQAIAEDSSYAPANAGLAFNHAFAGDEPRARRFADKAVRLDPRLADAHMVVGMIRQFFEWDWVGSEKAFREAIRLNPGHAEAHHELSMLLMRRRRFDEALVEGLRAWSYAPTSMRFEHGVGEVQLFSGRYDEAIKIAKKLLRADSSFVGAYFLLGGAYTEQERYADAANAWRTCLQIAPSPCDPGRAKLGYIHALTGRRADALKVIQTLEARWHAERGKVTAGAFWHNPAMDLAKVYAGLRETEAALSWLERGAESGGSLVYLGIDLDFERLRAEPRFRALLKKIGLDE